MCPVRLERRVKQEQKREKKQDTLTTKNKLHKPIEKFHKMAGAPCFFYQKVFSPENEAKSLETLLNLQRFEYEEPKSYQNCNVPLRISVETAERREPSGVLP